MQTAEQGDPVPRGEFLLLKLPYLCHIYLLHADNCPSKGKFDKESCASDVDSCVSQKLIL